MPPTGALYAGGVYKFDLFVVVDVLLLFLLESNNKFIM